MSQAEAQPIIHEVAPSPWRLGLFYADPADSRIFVPKRFGLGWTLNLGQPVAWTIVAFFVVLVFVSKSKARRR